MAKCSGGTAEERLRHALKKASVAVASDTNAVSISGLSGEGKRSSRLHSEVRCCWLFKDTPNSPELPSCGDDSWEGGRLSSAATETIAGEEAAPSSI
jgi:hypothetical protein